MRVLVVRLPCFVYHYCIPSPRNSTAWAGHSDVQNAGVCAVVLLYVQEAVLIAQMAASFMR